MKDIFQIQKTIFAAFIFFGLTACGGQFMEDEFFDDEEFFTEQEINNSVMTLKPDVSSGTAVFKGEVTFQKGQENVEYGFMWYALNHPDHGTPERIMLGTTTSGRSFSIEMTDLPLETELIVCAFVKPESWQDDLIGDEEDFTVPL